MIAFLDGDPAWNAIACPAIVTLLVFGFCYSLWRHHGAGRRPSDKGYETRGFDVIDKEQHRGDKR